MPEGEEVDTEVNYWVEGGLERCISDKVARTLPTGERSMLSLMSAKRRLCVPTLLQCYPGAVVLKDNMEC